MSIEEAVLEKMLTLDSDRKQQVLDFVEFLQYRRYESWSDSGAQVFSHQAEKPVVSALDLAGDVVGCVKDAPTDLSTNKKYMEGFGQE